MHNLIKLIQYFQIIIAVVLHFNADSKPIANRIKRRMKSFMLSDVAVKFAQFLNDRAKSFIILRCFTACYHASKKYVIANDDSMFIQDRSTYIKILPVLAFCCIDEDEIVWSFA